MTQRLTATARWFDGQENRPQEVRVRLGRDHLEFMPWPPQPPTTPPQPPSAAEIAAERPSLPGLRRYARDALRVGEWWQDSPTPVVLPDGGTIWIPADSAMGRALGGQATSTRLIASWRGAVCCLVALIALLVWFDRQGAGLAAQVAMPLVPTKLDQAIGLKVEQEVMRRWVQPSQVPRARTAEIRGRFDAIADRVFPGLYPRLVFGRMPGKAGFNAFALPNNTIILFDGMTEALTDDELMAVLGHEAGHLKHRHAMRQIVQSAGLLSVAGVMLGDYSTVAATALGTLQTLRYSRNAERESDAEAQRLILSERLPNETLVGVWTKMQAEIRAQMARRGQEDQQVPEWLSTHPSMQERLESARRAAQAAEPLR